MESRLSGQDVGFDLGPGSDDEDRPYVAPAAFLRTETSNPEMHTEAEDWQDHHNNLLYQGLDQLDDRSFAAGGCRKIK
jgi:RNA polymerase sigma-32 factor